MPQLRGLPTDPLDTRLSKTLAYLLRHGAEKHDLPMRLDGYVRVADLLEDPMLTNGILTVEKLKELVRENAKQRFVMIWARDETPEQDRPRRKAGQGKGKGGGKGKRNGHAETIGNETTGSTSTLPPDPGNQLPLIPCDEPENESPASNPPEPQYYIRAAQGHSIQTVQTEALLTPVKLDEPEDLEKVGEMVHGTKWENWDAICSTGLSRMTRNHIHLSTSSSHPSCRPNSTLLIYLSPTALLLHRPDPIPVFVSSNGVVLTPGDENGYVGKEMWRKVVRVRRERLSEVPQAAGTAESGEVDQLEFKVEAVTLESGPPAEAAATGSQADEQATKAAARKAAKEKKKQGGKGARSGGGDSASWKQWKEIVWEDVQAVDPPRLLEDGQ